MNSWFIGFPIVLDVFGSEGFFKYRLLRCINNGSVCPLWYGTYWNFGGDKKAVIKNGLKFIPLWSIILGLSFNMSHIQLGNFFYLIY